MAHIGIEFVPFIDGKKNFLYICPWFLYWDIVKKTFLNNTRILLNGEDRDKLALCFTVFYKLKYDILWASTCLLAFRYGLVWLHLGTIMTKVAKNSKYFQIVLVKLFWLKFLDSTFNIFCRPWINPWILHNGFRTGYRILKIHKFYK